MVKNYLLIALRYMSKQRGFSVINISGLTIGIVCSLLILLYVQNELEYDKFHRDGDRIYRVIFDGKIQGKKINSIYTGFPLASTLPKEISGIEDATRVVSWATFPVHAADSAFTEKYILLADKNFFKFFDFELSYGSANNVLTGERKVVMSESAVKRYFNLSEHIDSAVGKPLELAQGFSVNVSGVAKDAPATSHLHYSLILSLDSWPDALEDDWISLRSVTYIKLKPGANPTQIEQQIKSLITNKINEQLNKTRNISIEEFQKEGNELNYLIQPLYDIHLNSHLSDEIENNGSLHYIYLFSSIAAFITIIACINFMNLTTAQSASRAKEVAVRKSVGAQNNRLIVQFLVESYLFVVIAVVLAFFILLGALPAFSFFTNKQIQLTALFDIKFISGILVFVLITGLVAGSYPAFYLTTYSPIEVLKGNLRAKLRSYGIRNVLVIFQFFISSGLIIATMIVYYQIEYAQRMNVGFDKENVINLLHTRNLGTNGNKFKEELLKNPLIISASYCNRLPPNVDWQSVFHVENSQKDFLLVVYEMDYDHLKTMGYSMVDGRFFSANFPNDSLAIIINEKAAENLGVRDFEGKKLFSSYDQPNGRMREIVGIIKDFNFQSLKDPIQPMAVVLGKQPNWEMAIRIKDPSAISFVNDLWKKYVPTAPFEYAFLDKNFEQKLLSQKRVGMLFIFFTILAILIACLGLFGLATFTADQQRKAIGIRKVLGATVSDIVRRLNQDFLKLVLIANLLSWPITWWIMNQWLKQFAYHISQPWWIFVLAGAITFLIAFFSVSFQALKAASGNPLNSLRNE
jgi:putative ABC transport system permease protein